MPEYAVAITFPQNSTAYEALSKLSAAPGGFEIRSAAIVERDKEGHLHVPEGGDTMAGAGTVGGSLIRWHDRRRLTETAMRGPGRPGGCADPPRATATENQSTDNPEEPR
jgi:hypothetical protein